MTTCTSDHKITIAKLNYNCIMNELGVCVAMRIGGNLVVTATGFLGYLFDCYYRIPPPKNLEWCIKIEQEINYWPCMALSKKNTHHYGLH